MLLSTVTPIVLTFNEAANIERNLAGLAWANRVVVVDSGSSDETVALVGRSANARFFTRPFDSHANQWNYALTQTGTETEWVLVLDADHMVTDELVRELEDLTPPSDVNGFRANFTYCLEGRALRGSLYPPTTVLFRRQHGRFVQDGHTQRVVCGGKIGELREKLLHDDRKPIERWLQSQARYMILEAAKLNAASWRELGWANRLRRLKVVAPFAVFLYCLFGKGLLFNGRAGLLYTLQRTTAEAILSMILLRQSLKRIVS
ncbi:MAG: glycosyltransferase family 2 protein [Rhodospirillales bacterium]